MGCRLPPHVDPHDIQCPLLVVGHMVQVLMLDSNQLTALPDSLGQLPRLERLSAAGNCLTALPATLGKLGTLLQLDVSANKLMALPPELGNCTALEELTASDNYLQVGPVQMAWFQLRAFLIPWEHAQRGRFGQHSR